MAKRDQKAGRRPSASRDGSQAASPRAAVTPGSASAPADSPDDHTAAALNVLA
ncbi:hypothetical protein DyAD56_14120 [Dyella sp. AD56]|nr:hypothetical protein DyAD56_14120 [Dyella sp. AD56]